MEPFCIHNKQAVWRLSRYYNRRRVIFTLINNATNLQTSLHGGK